MKIHGFELAPRITSMRHADRDDWLAGRVGSTGASSVASLFGIGWRTELQEYAIATGAMAPPEETEAMRMGHIMEPVARDLYEAETGHRTKDWGAFTILRNAEFPGMHTTLDFPILEANGKRKAPAVLECKNVGAYMVKDWKDGEIPLYVQMQVQAQLAVTGWEWGAVAAILGGGAFVYQFVERNENFIQALASRVERFWLNVKNGTPPEPTADDGEALRLLWPKHVEGKTLELGEEFVDIAARLEVKKLAMKMGGDEIRADENLLKAAFGDAEIIVLPDGTRYSCKRQVRKAHQVKESESRVLRRLKG